MIILIFYCERGGIDLGGPPLSPLVLVLLDMYYIHRADDGKFFLNDILLSYTEDND